MSSLVKWGDGHEVFKTRKSNTSLSLPPFLGTTLIGETQCGLGADHLILWGGGSQNVGEQTIFFQDFERRTIFFHEFERQTTFFKVY